MNESLLCNKLERVCRSARGVEQAKVALKYCTLALRRIPYSQICKHNYYTRWINWWMEKLMCRIHDASYVHDKQIKTK